MHFFHLPIDDSLIFTITNRTIPKVSYPLHNVPLYLSLNRFYSVSAFINYRY
jgi:hypothetical protein